MIVLCIMVFIYFIFNINITSIVNVFMLSIEKKKTNKEKDPNCRFEKIQKILKSDRLKFLPLKKLFRSTNDPKNIRFFL